MKINSKRLVAALSLALLWPSVSAQAQEADSGWDHLLVIYLLGPTLDGTVGLGPIDSEIDIDPSTVFDNLDMGFLGGWVSEKDKWGYMVDIVYMDLSADFKLAGDRVDGKLTNQQFIGNAAALYRLADNWQLLGGVNYNDLTMKLRLDSPLPPEPRRAKQSESWADPIIGLRYVTPISERWNFTGLGFVGGGVDADLTWSLNGHFDFEMTERTSLMLGYRYISFDYESGQGRDRFKFDMVEHGFAAGFMFRF